MLDRRGAMALSALAIGSPELPAARCSGWVGPVPAATFGIQIYDDEAARRFTLQAIEAGFRSFFTSPEAGNQRGFAKALRESGVPRNEIFIAGSLLSDDAVSFRSAYHATAAALDASLSDLSAGGVETLDLLMLERPARTDGAIHGQWDAMQEGRATAGASLLGVCNFDLDDLDLICDGNGSGPAVNQVPFSLGIRMDHARFVRDHSTRGVIIQAWGPLGGPDALIPRAVLSQAAALGQQLQPQRSAYAVALRWILQQGAGFVVHSRVYSHLKEDLDALDFDLRIEDVQSLSRAAASGFATQTDSRA